MADLIAELSAATQQSVANIFDTMLSMPIAFQGEATADDVRKHGNVIVGLIGIDGEFKGSIGVVFSPALGRRLVNAMLGMDEPSDGDISDVTGEMANMIAGGVKNILESRMPHFTITCPTVIRGQFDFPRTSNQSVSVLKFQTEEIFYSVIVSTHS